MVVVVSRWFGGVLLGPSRFTLINNTARALLEELVGVGGVDVLVMLGVLAWVCAGLAGRWGGGLTVCRFVG